MRYRIEYADGRCCNFANSRKDLLDWLKLLKDEQIVDIRKIYKSGVKDGKTIYTTDVIVEEHEFAQNKDSGAGADSSETPKTDKDGFMEAKDGEIPFD